MRDIDLGKYEPAELDAMVELGMLAVCSCLEYIPPALIIGNRCPQCGDVPHLIKPGGEVLASTMASTARNIDSVRESVLILRKLLGMTQSELARAVGVHRNTICNLEAGRTGRISGKVRSALASLAREAGRMDLDKALRVGGVGQQLLGSPTN